MTGLVSFTLFGIEEIGVEIENTFGEDPNDLPLDAICQTMLRNIEELITLTPSSRPSGGAEEWGYLDRK
jgi:ion channel-forming bestrophin family protein